MDSLNNYKEVHSKFVEATKEYRELCKDVKDARKQFLQDRAKYAAMLKNTTAEKEIKSIIEIERQRDQSKRINTVMKGRHGGGPNSLLIPAITEYDTSKNNIDHFAIDTIWDRIELHNGEDIENWERVTDQRLVVSMLLA